MDRDRSVDALGESPHLADLEPDQLRDLFGVVQPRTFVSGEPIWSVGEVGEAAYLLVSGEVESTIRVQPEGKKTRIVGEAGTWMGLAHLAGEWEHESTAYPVERTEVLKLERGEFREMFDRRHPAAFAVADAVADRLVEEVRDANRRHQEVFGHPAETLRMLRRRTGDSGRR